MSNTNYVDLAGQRYGKLIVMKRAGSNKHGKALWLCKCDCGNEIEVVGNYLTRDHTKSCGCLKKRQHKDLTGMMFGKWLVKEYLGKKEGSNHHYWLCECQCENKTLRKVQERSLLTGGTHSCGCTWADNFKEYYRENNMDHGMTNTRFYRIWGIMKRRCYDKNFDSYPHYGGKGIEVCERWKESFVNFKEDMYDKYTEHSSVYGEENTSIDRIDVTRNYEPGNCRWSTWKEQSVNKNNTIMIEFNGENKPLTIWCEELGIPYTMAVQRYERGKTVENILSKEIKRITHYIEYRGETKSLRKWCLELGFCPDTILHRMKKQGMTFEEAISKPIKDYKFKSVS